MRSKLKNFTEFANGLLPLESDYLLQIGQLEDPDRIRILNRIRKNNQRITNFLPYDVAIDKRKYSGLKKWIQKKLQTIDVDEKACYIGEMKTAILTDTIRPEQEAILLRRINTYQYPSFYFGLWYEMLLHYRHFLLIRLRQTDYELVDRFLKAYHAQYDKYLQVQEQLLQATDDVVRQYQAHTTESIQWEKWLSQVFYNETLDGYSRYMAFVRLSFISFNYRRIDSLIDKFDYLDNAFRLGGFYSRRILVNYYHLRLIAHAKARDYETAIRFGYYSIRDRNHDYLFYVNNLSAVLLRAKKHTEALELMRSATGEMKASKNHHNRIGFVAYYIRALLQAGKYRNAVSYAHTFYRAYAREILRLRWHTYFAIYLQALFRVGDFDQIVLLANKHKLVEREQEEFDEHQRWPVIKWWVRGARYLLDPQAGSTLAADLHLMRTSYEQREDPVPAEQLHLLEEKIPALRTNRNPFAGPLHSQRNERTE